MHRSGIVNPAAVPTTFRSRKNHYFLAEKLATDSSDAEVRTDAKAQTPFPPLREAAVIAQLRSRNDATAIRCAPARD